MTVRYILGRAGKGKSRLVFKEIKKDLSRGGEYKLLLLVPEQYTLQAERDLIAHLSMPGIMRAEVLSITRLAERVFTQAGGITRTLLNEQGKTMILRKIMDDNNRDLSIFKNASRQEGFINSFSQLLSEFKQLGIKPADLLSASRKMEEKEMSRQKLQDIALIYEHFNEYLAERYLDSEDYLQLFLEKLPAVQSIRDARVWIDGFSTFSPRSIQIIGRIMSLAHDTSISLTLDTNQDKHDAELFSLSCESLQRMRQMAQKLGLPEEIVAVESKAADALRTPEMRHLEAEFFSYPGRKFSGNVRNLEVFAAGNRDSEIEFLAARLVSLARNGYRWRDMAVVCQDMDDYGGLIKRIFYDYQIPCFMDRKRDIMNSPIVELILSSLDIIRGGYRYEDVFRLLKTGFSDLDPEQCEILENYVLQYGIKGKQWKECFTQGEGELLDELNHCREALVVSLEKFASRVKKVNSIASFTEALYGYLEDIQIREKLGKWIGDFRERGQFEQAHENTRIWNTITEIFDQLMEILGEQKVGLKEYKRILETGFLSIEAGVIPPGVDEVLVGNIQRSISHDIKGLFVVGVNDGILPSRQGEEGILSTEEKELLQLKGLNLFFNRDQSFAEERFLIYTAFSKPREFLRLSYALADEEGKGLRPSMLLDRCKKIFPGLKADSNILDDYKSQMQMISSPSSTFKHLVKNLRLGLDGKPMEAIWWDVYDWYLKERDWEQRREITIAGFFHNNQPVPLGKKLAGRIYRTPLHSSISRMEQYVKCPFAHFVRYGLEPAERKLYSIGSPDIGEILHDCLLSFSRELQSRKIAWQEIRNEDCDLIMDDVVEDIIPRFGNGIFISSPRYRYMLKRLQRTLKRSIRVLAEHLKQGDFNPLGYEVRFGSGGSFPPIVVDLENGERVFLEGRIDRLDILEEEGKSYIKILDYKSGSKEFNLSDVYNGLTIQLLVYLWAVLESEKQFKGKEIKPAGIFYFKIDDPLVNSDEELAEKVEHEIMRKLRLKGLALQDVNVVRQMDKNISDHSDILPLGFNREGDFYKSSSVLGERQFFALIDHIKNLLKEIGGEIMKGNIKIEPFKNKRQMACTYCDFPSFCQFDRLFPENDYRQIKDLENEEVIRKLDE